MDLYSDEYLFYYNQYEKASDFNDYVDCSDLIKEFEQMSIQYQKTRDVELHQKFESNIKSFYKRGLPEWLGYLDFEIQKSEGKYLEYFEEKNELLNIRKKFEQNNLELSEFNDLLTQFEELDSKVKIKKAIEKNTRNMWIYGIIIGFILGLIPTILKLVGVINF